MGLDCAIGAIVLGADPLCDLHREYRPAKNKGKVALPAEAPLVSILKPLRAMDDDLQCNLES